MSFLPEDYEVPSSSGGYFKPTVGDNKLRILSDVVIGWQYWNVDNKPVRMREKPEGIPSDIRVNDDGKPDRVKHFWAVLIWNYDSSQLQVWEITQSSIQGALADFANDEDWGHPKSYNILLKKEGEKLKTEYSVIPKPAKPLDNAIIQQWQNTKVNLEAIFEEEASPLNYDGIMPDGSAGSYNESRAVRMLNDMVKRAQSDESLLEKAAVWAKGDKQFPEISRFAGSESEAQVYIESVTQVIPF